MKHQCLEENLRYLGEPCKNNEHCETGLKCDENKKYCVKKNKDVGEDCTKSNECKENLYCNIISKKCTKRIGIVRDIGENTDSECKTYSDKEKVINVTVEELENIGGPVNKRVIDEEASPELLDDRYETRNDTLPKNLAEDVFLKSPKKKVL